jgi:hypothetical protein
MSSTRRSSRAWRAVNFFVSFDRRFPVDPVTHKVYLIAALIFTLLPFVLTASSESDKKIKLAGVQLPASCVSKRLLNADCPGCGLTHSFVHLTHGNIRESIHWNRVGIPLYLYFLFQIAFRSYVLKYPATLESRMAMNLQHYTALTTIALILINWSIGLWLGSNGS